jgi:predicted dehydrogenase
MKALRLLVIGTKFGSTYLDAAKMNPNWEIAGIVARSSMNRIEPGKKYGIPSEYQYDSVKQALENCPDVDAVVVAVPNNSHHEIAAQVLDKGYHLILEKPITETWGEAVDLIHRLDAHPGTKAMVGQTLRGEYNLRMMEWHLKQGIIGRVEHITFNSHWWWIDDPQKSWRFTLPNMFLDDIAIHQFEVIRMLTDRAKCETVTAETFTPPSYPIPTLRTTASGIMHLEKNIHVNFFGSMGCKGEQVGWYGKIEIMGEKGSMYRDPYGEPYVILHGEKNKIGLDSEEVADALPYIEYEKIPFLLEDFAHAIRENRSPVTDLRDNINTHAILLGMKLSAERHQQVKIADEFFLP